MTAIETQSIVHEAYHTALNYPTRLPKLFLGYLHSGIKAKQIDLTLLPKVCDIQSLVVWAGFHAIFNGLTEEQLALFQSLKVVPILEPAYGAVAQLLQHRTDREITGLLAKQCSVLSTWKPLLEELMFMKSTF